MKNEYVVSCVLNSNLKDSFIVLQNYWDSDAPNSDKGALAAIYIDRVLFSTRKRKDALIIFYCLKNKLSFRDTNLKLRCETQNNMFYKLLGRCLSIINM